VSHRKELVPYSNKSSVKLIYYRFPSKNRFKSNFINHLHTGNVLPMARNSIQNSGPIS